MGVGGCLSHARSLHHPVVITRTGLLLHRPFRVRSGASLLGLLHPPGAPPEEVLLSCGLMFPACGWFLECTTLSIAAVEWGALL